MRSVVMVLMAAAAFSSCSNENHLLFGEVEAQVGGHRIQVTDCYRWKVPPPIRLADVDGRPAYQFMPCRDANVELRGNELAVNGRNYGRIGAATTVLVDHGRVVVAGRDLAAGGAR
jgi:hypothetical protein